MDTLTFCSYNVSGLQNRTKRKKVFTLIKDHRVDIALLQESHSTGNISHLWQSEWGGNMFCSHGSSESCGVMTLFRRGLLYEILQSYFDDEGRVLILEIKIEEITYLIVNIYAPNNDQPEFFVEVAKRIESFENRNIIWGGDFNLVLDVLKDRYKSTTNNYKAKAILEQYINESDLVDIWRAKNQDMATYTFFRRNPLAMSRLDYFLIADGLASLVERVDILNTPMSDHSLVLLTVCTTTNPRGKGYWKFNTSHLYKLEFLKALNQRVDDTIRQTSLSNPVDRWETLKTEIIDFCKSKSQELSQTKMAKIRGLYDKLKQIKQIIDNDPTDFDKIKDDYMESAREVDEYLDNKTRGILLRSKTLWYSQGERSSKYYFSLEKNNANKKRIISLETRDGNITKNQKKIIDKQFHLKL